MTTPTALLRMLIIDASRALNAGADPAEIVAGIENRVEQVKGEILEERKKTDEQ